jgi:hypothetical protein
MNHGYRKRRRDTTKGTNNLFNRIIAKNFPNLKKKRVIQIQDQEAYRTPNCQNQKKKKTQHIIIKTFSKENKERILKAAKDKR